VNTRSAFVTSLVGYKLSKQFWKTQPVPQLGGSSSAPLEEGPIDELKHVKDVKQEPGALPSGFEWSLIDIKNDEQVSFLY
jgi:glycylpeptide N-tetradecanoyltransferase